MQDGDQWRTLGHLRGPLLTHSDDLANANLYCLHGKFEREFGVTFQLDSLDFGDTYVFFRNLDEFFGRFKSAAVAEGHEMDWRTVEYVSSYTGRMGLFRKFSQRAADQEVRAVVQPGLGRPLELTLGDLSDIAQIGSASDRLQLLPTTSDAILIRHG